MGLFSRRSARRGTDPDPGKARPSADPPADPLGDPPADPSAADSHDAEGPVAAEEARPLRPTGRPLTPEHKATLERSLEELAAAGIDTGDLAAISAAHDDASAEWHRLPGRTQAATPPPTDRFAVAIGEYLCRATDLGWATVVDPLGTDLGLIAERDDFAVIPGNLVTSRWLNGELGWIPGVIGHVVRVRSDAW